MRPCPKCHQLIRSNEIQCPHCGATLKAFGHAGIDLFHAVGDAPLCETCTYHLDNTCTYTKRPTARECTLYQDVHQPLPPAKPKAPAPFSPAWLRQNSGLVAIAGLILISLLLALWQRR
ncbi:MAG: hypothetical protein B0A82_17055 [Alkalinema sp. CACIAM 70d]|nr:MAG: hypothetical protein B0A82_17055 [Alkalinema sp. CACIAM 70d]